MRRTPTRAAGEGSRIPALPVRARAQVSSLRPRKIRRLIVC